MLKPFLFSIFSRKETSGGGHLKEGRANILGRGAREKVTMKRLQESLKGRVLSRGRLNPLLFYLQTIVSASRLTFIPQTSNSSILKILRAVAGPGSTTVRIIRS